jgi:serine/threonine protein kinase
MITKLPDEEAIFKVACQISSPAARAEYLNQVCGDDQPAMARIQALLRVHDEESRFLISPPPGIAATLDTSLPKESAGSQIGPYKLLEQIGEGGMGTVWMAQQSEPVKRLVALKLIKAGMDSRQVIARFEAERQALALMDHPNIARVLDAGATSAGRPYFVMDLVRGVPITQYCDERHLTPRQRLELFVPVCQALQHAHQKGIIHRDLKPSNVLVALYDGRPVPKVIDFGVAKAAGQPLTEQTLVTGFGNIVGTLEYMSPEQAELNQLDIDTRSDIYSLGVLLYELLTGSPPFSRKDLENAGMLEMLRVIREQEPAKPSTKLSTAEGLHTLAANRGTEPAKLTKLVRGELDWIVMKALEKDRHRRYETATGLAEDLQRYLADEPVAACPPSLGYRLRKLLRRHRRRVAVAVAIAALLLMAGLFAFRAHHLERHRLAERQRHDEAILVEKRQNALDKAMLVAMSGDLEAADNAIGEAELLGASAGQVRMLRGQVAYYRHEQTEAIGHLEQAVRLLPESMAARGLLACAYVRNMQRQKSAQTLQDMDRLSAVTSEDYLFKGLAESFHDPQRALKTLEEAFRRRDATSAQSTIARAIRGGAYTRLAWETGDLAVAEQALEHVAAVRAMMPGNPYPLVSSLWAHLLTAELLEEAGQSEQRQAVLAQAERDFRALERFPTHPGAVHLRYLYLEYTGRTDDAFEELGRISEQTTSQWILLDFAQCLYRRGEYQKAVEFLDRQKEGPGRTHTFHMVRAIAAAELPDGPARALESYKDATALAGEVEAGFAPVFLFAPDTVLLFLGRKAEAVAASREIRRQADLHGIEAGPVLDYACGLISADELLEAAGRSRVRRSGAHFRIALHLLADGDRSGAREQFRRCIAANFLFAASHVWAEAFLARMEQDPAWPPWIPLRE